MIEAPLRKIGIKLSIFLRSNLGLTMEFKGKKKAFQNWKAFF